MASVKQIYDMAIHLMDEQNDTTGSTVSVDTQEYRLRTVPILNTIIPALRPYSGDFDNAGPGRPAVSVLYGEDHANPVFDQEIPLDDTLSYALLPYYLAAQLLCEEDPERAAWFMNIYRELRNDLKNKVPERFRPIRAPYGLF